MTLKPVYGKNGMNCRLGKREDVEMVSWTVLVGNGTPRVKLRKKLTKVTAKKMVDGHTT